TLRQVKQFLERTVKPALDDLAKEFDKQGYTVERTGMMDSYDIEEPVFRVAMEGFRDFHYQVAVVEAPVPMFTGRMTRETDLYYRLEVFTQTGSGGYDLMGLTQQQIIDDVLERYEAHLSFLTLTSQTDTASVLTPPIPPADTPSSVAEEAGDVHDLDKPKNS